MKLKLSLTQPKNTFDGVMAVSTDLNVTTIMSSLFEGCSNGLQLSTLICLTSIIQRCTVLTIKYMR